MQQIHELQAAPNPMEMQPDFAVFTLLFFGCLVLGSLVLLVTLIVNRKTRPIGLGIAGVLAVVAIIIPFVAYLSFERKIVHDFGGYPSIVNLENARQAEATMWTCSMHPQIRQPRSGKCPLCGMNLVPVSTSTEGDSSDEKITTTPEPDQPARAKPDWVTAPPKRVGDSYRRVIQSGPFVSEDGCNRQLDELMTTATSEYLDQLVGTENGLPAQNLRRLGITPSYIRQRICKDEYIETVESSVGPMKQIYILMEFDADVQNKLRRLWKDMQLEERLAVVGVGSGAVLLLLGAVFGFLKFDTATKGFYTKRLIFGAITVTMLAALILVWVVNQ